MTHPSEAGLRLRPAVLVLALSAVLIAAVAVSSAATLCVNPGGKSGCYATIAAAVTAAAANDTVKVAGGTYPEDVVIGKSLALIGTGPREVVIDASGLANGIYIDGIDNPGLANVVVSGFTVKNANFEGILATNCMSLTIWGNRVVNNNKALDPAALTCPGIPDFETLEGFDCGEGIHLSGVAYSVLGKNAVENNAGGILLSDDTGATHDNVLSGNRVADNAYDCGITLASHPPAAIAGSAAPLGVFHNTIVGNESMRNGLAVGEGAGVGIFASVPGTMNYGNVVIQNRLTGNGLPGVTMHGHAPGQNLDGNKIIGNYIADNNADTDPDGPTPAPTGINIFSVVPAAGTLILQNVIDREDVAIATRTPAQVDVHLNDLRDGGSIGVDNLGAGSVNATLNWWGCPGGPGSRGCSTTAGPNILFAPWAKSPVTDPRGPY